MRAVRATADGVDVVDVPPPDESDGVRVNIRGAGICGSDLTFVGMGELPFTLGHELAGVLDDGTPVAIEPIAPCETCDQCSAGEYHRCRNGALAFIGSGRDGGMADHLRVPERALVQLPAGLDVSDASLVEPMAVALHGLRVTGARAGLRVGVVGAGTIGLCAAAGAKALGCDVGLVTRHQVQRRAAEALGIPDANEDEYDIVVEAAGSESAMARAAELAAPGATLLVLGLHTGQLPVPGIPALMKELRVISTIMYNCHERGRDVDDAAELLAAEPSVPTALVTHRFPLDQARQAFRVAADRSAGAVKVVLEP